MRRLALAAALALAVAACGDDGGGNHPDAADGPVVDHDASIDAMGDPTLTAFVIDLVQTQTADNTDSVAYAMFSDLADPDGENPTAYSVLFN